MDATTQQVKILWEMGFLPSSKVFPHKLLINYKRDSGNFLGEKLAGTTFNTLSKLTSSELGHTDIMHSLGVLYRERHNITFMVFWTKM